MQGNQVFRHAVEKLASTANTALDRAGLSADDVDWIVPHQANIRIIQGTAKKMGLSMDNVVVTVQDHGNTSAASIPLALSVGKERGQIKEGDLIVTEAIGGGWPGEQLCCAGNRAALISARIPRRNSLILTGKFPPPYALANNGDWYGRKNTDTNGFE